eukprot:jgi/Psemu1/323095/estExt_fgenesh1_pg.C_560060
MVTITPVDENNNDVFSPDSLVGEKLLKDAKGPAVSTANALKASKPSLIGLYFSASWCPPCQKFTPLLTEFYEKAKASNSGLEIVFVSSDRGMEEFQGYYQKMPWLAIPPTEGSASIKQNLSNTLGVTAIPSIAIIDAKTGEIVAGGEARDDIIRAGGDGAQIAATVQKWKDAERYPLSEGPRLMDAGSGGRHPLFKFLSFLAKNPMIIFGLIYFYQWMQRKMIEMGYDDDGTTAPAVPVDDTPPSDTEF